jgi:hypothetical protein
MSRAGLSSSLSAGGRVAEPWRPFDLRGSVPIVLAAFEDGARFLDALAPGGLEVATRVPLPEGAPVVLEIGWHGIPNRVFVRGEAGRRRGPGTLLVRIRPDEGFKRDWLVRAAKGDLTGVQARLHRRFYVRLPVRWRPFGDRLLHPGVAEDLSAGGVLVAAPPDSAVAAGTRVAIRLRAGDPGAEVVLTGRVQHVRARQAALAFGVTFEYRSSGEQRTLRAILRAFAARGTVAVDPSL